MFRTPMCSLIESSSCTSVPTAAARPNSQSDQEKHCHLEGAMPASGLILPRCPPSTVRRRVRCARSDGQVQERMDDVSHTLCVHRCKQHLRRADRRLTPTARRTFSGRRACTQLNPTSSGVPGSAPRGTAGGGAEAAVGDRVARRRCRQEADCGRASVDACRDRLVSVRRSGSLGRYDRFLAAMTYWQSPCGVRCQPCARGGDLRDARDRDERSDILATADVKSGRLPSSARPRGGP